VLGVVAALVLGAAVVAAGIYIGTKNSNNSQPSTTSQPTTTTPTTAPPVAEAALEGLLLSPDQINNAMGATGMTVKGTGTSMNSDDVPYQACLRMYHPAEAAAYAGSGWSAMRGQALKDPGAHGWTDAVFQFVVLFPSAQNASAFFTASAQQWPACSNRQFTAHAPGKPDVVFTVGPVSNTNGTLSATMIQEPGGDSSWTWDWESCHHALTVANNVAIDIKTCTHNRSDPQSGAAVNIAHQIAAQVPKT
jgi:serine/threonine-protein kinase